VIGGFENRQIVGYQNLEELMERIRPSCQYVRLEDCVDIPAKIYQKVSVPLSPEQKSAIRELKEEGSIVVESLGVELYVDMALERMTRIQQIVGGSLPYIDVENGGYETMPMPGKNPKMEAMFDYIESLGEGEKCLIWARFTPERDRIMERLIKEYGENSVVRYDGKISDADRKIAVTRLQEDPDCRFFLSNQTVGGIGLTLTKAKYSLNYSNTFSSEDRVQMENRNHRTGQKDHCVYVDFEADVKEDKMILKALFEKKSLSDMVRESIENRDSV
jgi:SNF2 family DNA or RNA helicase